MVVPIGQFVPLNELSVGVVNTFQPTHSELVGHYLREKVFDTQSSNYKTFPEICIYGENGSPPWEIWRSCEQDMYPHQDFIYFFSRAKKMNPDKPRKSRKVGTDGYTWSSTQKEKPVSIGGDQEPSGSMRTYRYEKKNTKGKKGKKEGVVDDDNHGAWLMEEFTIKSSPDLALCRLKRNDRGDRNKKRKKSSAAEEEVNLRSMNKHKLDERTKSTSQQMPSSSFHGDTDQVAQMVPENSDNNFCDELEQKNHTLIMHTQGTSTSQQMPSSCFHGDTDQVAHVVPANSDNNLRDALIEIEQELMKSDDDENVMNTTAWMIQEQFSDCLVAPQQWSNEQQRLSDYVVDIPWMNPIHAVRSLR